MAVPRLANILGTIQTTADRVSSAVPVIQKAYADTVNIAAGKNPQPYPAQQPAAVDSLVPRNVGQLDQGLAAGISTSMLVFGGLAIFVVFFLARRR